MNTLEEFKKLIEVCDRLLGEGGCPWDREQTMKSSRKYVLEEVSELIDAINLDDNEDIKEELGDLFYNTIFLSKLAEKENRCNLNDVLKDITKKLINRHPHVFQDVIVNNSDEVLENWEKIKGKEAMKMKRKSALDGIPKTLPALARSEKVIGKMKKANFPNLPKDDYLDNFSDEAALGKALLNLVVMAEEKKLDPENALKKSILLLEKDFQEFEENN